MIKSLWVNHILFYIGGGVGGQALWRVVYGFFGSPSALMNSLCAFQRIKLQILKRNLRVGYGIVFRRQALDFIGQTFREVVA